MASPHIRSHDHAACGYAEPTSVTSYDWAINVLHQPSPPTVREILHAYSKNGKDDKELLLALLKAKASEDNRIATQTALHRSLVHLQYNLPLSPSPDPESESYHLPPPLSLPSRSSPHHLHTYPSPSASSPRTNSPPSNTLPPIHLPPLSHALGKRPRSPPPSHHSSSSSPPSRASHMSLRGLLQEGHGGSLDSPRSAKRRNVQPSAPPLATATVTYHPSESVHVSPRGHRLSHERTTSRGD